MCSELSAERHFQLFRKQKKCCSHSFSTIGKCEAKKITKISHHHREVVTVATTNHHRQQTVTFVAQLTIPQPPLCQLRTSSLILTAPPPVPFFWRHRPSVHSKTPRRSPLEKRQKPVHHCLSKQERVGSARSKVPES